MNEIEWERKSRPRQKDQGHTLVRFGWLQDEHRAGGRQFAECQCGKRFSRKTFSRWATDQTYYAWTRHLKTLGIR